MIRFKDRFRDHFKARYNKIPGCGVSWIGNVDLERFDCCDRGGGDRWWLRFLRGQFCRVRFLRNCEFCGVGSVSERQKGNTPPAGAPKSSKKQAGAHKSSKQVERRKFTEQAEAQKNHRANWSTQKLTEQGGHPKAHRVSWNTQMLKSEREHTKAPEQMEPPKSSQKWGAKSSQNKLKRKKNTEPTRVPKCSKGKREHPNAQKNKWST